MIEGSISFGSLDHLIDGDLETIVRFDYALAPKLKFNLGNIKCVSEIVVSTADNENHTYVCTPHECTCLVGNSCADDAGIIFVDIETAGAVPENLPENLDCKYGDTVKLESKHGFYPAEVTFNGVPGL